MQHNIYLNYLGVVLLNYLYNKIRKSKSQFIINCFFYYSELSFSYHSCKYTWHWCPMPHSETGQILSSKIKRKILIIK